MHAYAQLRRPPEIRSPGPPRAGYVPPRALPVTRRPSCRPAPVVTEVVPRTGGTLSTVHEVRLAGADPLIVKRYADEWRWKQAKEVHVYALLAEHGVGPAPRVVRVDRPAGSPC